MKMTSGDGRCWCDNDIPPPCSTLHRCLFERDRDLVAYKAALVTALVSDEEYRCRVAEPVREHIWDWWQVTGFGADGVVSPTRVKEDL